MANLSQEKRQRMLKFLDDIRQEHKNDDSVLIAINEIESELNAKKYGLVWEQHEEAVDVKIRDNIPVFTECKDKEISVAPGDDYNFILEGDNLHSLRLLEKTHAGRIDVIYIDPPYNTGNKDFVYDDIYVVKEDGYSHSKWISFMEARLRIAHRLLSNDGIIFISIDDNEQAQLKLLCDDIFDESNFIAQVVWERAYSPVNLKKHFSRSHDYILCYAKDISEAVCNGLPRDEAADKRYINPDNDPRGPWKPGDLSVGPAVQQNIYPIETPSGRVVYPPTGYSWRLSQSAFQERVKDNRIWFGPDGNNVPAVKRFLSELRKTGITPMTIWKYQDVGHSQDASQKLKELFDGEAVFEYPKPVGLIKRCVELYSKKDSIVLDFFAGSGTTGQAVMELNKADGGSRRFILCTNNENDICEKVTYERIKRVINGHGETNGIPANIKYFRTDFISKDSEEIREQLLDHVSEMIELENGIKLDGHKYVIVLSDEDAEYLEKHWTEYPDIKVLYVAEDIPFTGEQEALFNTVDLRKIPSYYFKFEMQEVGEIW